MILKKILLLAALMCAELLAAQSFTVDNLLYTFNGKYPVLEGISSDYTGSKITIPQYVNYEGYNYDVTDFEKTGNEFLATNANVSEIEFPYNFNLSVGSFIQNEQLQSVKLPGSMKELPDSLFSQCINLSNVELPQNLTTIRENVFRRCLSLKSIDFPESVTDIWRYSFNGAGLEGTVVFPSSLHNVGIYAFAGSSLEVVDMSNVDKDFEAGKEGKDPDDVTTAPNDRSRLGSGMFSYCRNLREVKLNDAWKVIPRKFCTNCDKLESVTWPSSLLKIRMQAFENCSSLEYAQIGDNIQFILDHAFDGCSKLESINGPIPQDDPDFNPLKIPSTLQEIRFCAFKGTALIGDLVVPETVTRLGSEAFEGTNITSAVVKTKTPYITAVEIAGVSLFKNCKNLQSLVLADGWSNIPNSICEGCSSLSSVILPQNWEFFGDNCFKNCALESIVIHGAVDGEDYPFKSQTMGVDVFSGNPLKSIRIEGSGPLLTFKGASMVPSVTNELEELVIERAECPSVNIYYDTYENGQYIRIEHLEWGPLGLPFNYMQEGVYHNPFYFKLEGEAKEHEADYRLADYWKEFFQIILTEVNDVDADSFSVETADGELRIKADGDVRVYSMDGMQVYAGGACNLQLPKGVYIVALDNGRTGKYMVR